MSELEARGPEEHDHERIWRSALLRQPGLISAARITFAHFSVSVARKRPNSAGAIGIGTPPRSRMRALILGSARAAVTPLLSLSTMSRGVPAALADRKSTRLN